MTCTQLESVPQSVLQGAIATQPIAPFGIELAVAYPMDVADLSIDHLKSLVLEHQIVCLRGFRSLDKTDFIEFAKSFGGLLEWNFGYVLELFVHEQPKNYLFTNGNVPYHWDGAFAKAVPWLQCFQCLEATEPGSGGETIFCDTTKALANATPEELALWRSIEITYRTDQKAHYGGEKTQKLIESHPMTGKPTIRFAEPMNAETVDLNPVFLDIRQDGRLLNERESSDFLAAFLRRMYASDVVYTHTWQDGDFLLTDNHALLHGRRPFFSSTRRHLQRIHVM
jgi:alpha-ketoglutarate-dependent taurine dioxygenase